MLYRSVRCISLLMLGILVFSGCGKKITSVWTVKPIKVDGDNSDWNEIPRSYDEDHGVLFGMCNDADKLYILFQFRNNQYLMSAAQNGFKVWLNPDGSKKKQYGIRYVCNPPQEAMQDMMQRRISNMPPEMRSRVNDMNRNIPEQILVMRGEDEPGVSIKADGTEGPAAKLGECQGVFVYELAIPLDNAGANLFGIGTEVGSEIMAGLEFGGMDRKKMADAPQQKGARGSGGMPPGGMPPGGAGRGGAGGRGAPGGGGMGGGPPGGFPGKGGKAGMQDMSSKEIWVKCALAEPVPGEVTE